MTGDMDVRTRRIRPPGVDAACRRLPTASYLLPSLCRLLPAAGSLVPPVCRLLPTAGSAEGGADA